MADLRTEADRRVHRALPGRARQPRPAAARLRSRRLARGQRQGRQADPSRGRRPSSPSTSAPRRPGHPRRGHGPAGDGRSRQGRHHPPRHERRQPAGRPGQQLQDARPARTSTTTTCGATRRSCRSAATSASSTGRTTRRSSSSASTRRSWPTRSCRPSSKDRGIWKRRFREINDWEHYLTDQGFRFVKLFLNLSASEEQRRRFLTRIDDARPELEVQRQRRQGARLLGRLPEGVQRRALEHEHGVGAVVRHPGRRQAVRPGRRRRRPRPHPHRDRPAVPDGVDRGPRRAAGDQGRTRRRRRPRVPPPTRSRSSCRDAAARSARKSRKGKKA